MIKALTHFFKFKISLKDNFLKININKKKDEFIIGSLQKIVLFSIDRGIIHTMPMF